VLERNLYDFKRIRAREKNLSKEEYQLLKTMRPFARFQSAEQHDKMVAGMIEELRLRRRIEQLKSYEQMGVEVLPHEAFEQRPNVETCGQSEREKRWLKRDREVLQRGSSESAQNLTDEERKVCSVLHLLPQHYDVMKHMLVHKAAHAGCLKQGVANQPLKIDIHKVLSSPWFWCFHNSSCRMGRPMIYLSKVHQAPSNDPIFGFKKIEWAACDKTPFMWLCAPRT